MSEPAGFQKTTMQNGYALVNGVEMNRRFGDRFAVVNRWFKKHVALGEFVEVRIDSDRFSAHPDAEPGCACELCGEEATKPILSHEHPTSLLDVPRQNIPSRGWGEEFWVQVSGRQDEWLSGVIDNHLYESKLHGLDRGAGITFHEDHILSIHGSHSQEILIRFSEEDRQEFGQWLIARRDQDNGL